MISLKKMRWGHHSSVAPGSDWALKVSFRVLAVPHKLGCALPNKWQIKCSHNWRAENVCAGQRSVLPPTTIAFLMLRRAV